MLEAFVGPCPPGMECCHNNGNRADNRIENLRWDTPKANQADAIRHGTRPKGERHWNAKITEEKAIEALKRFASGDRLAWIAADLGVSPSTIEALARGRAWKHIRDRLGLTFPVPTRGRPRKVAI